MSNEYRQHRSRNKAIGARMGKKFVAMLERGLICDRTQEVKWWDKLKTIEAPAALRKRTS